MFPASGAKKNQDAVGLNLIELGENGEKTRIMQSLIYCMKKKMMYG
jgi:hypothetical protein